MYLFTAEHIFLQTAILSLQLTILILFCIYIIMITLLNLYVKMYGKLYQLTLFTTGLESINFLLTMLYVVIAQQIHLSITINFFGVWTAHCSSRSLAKLCSWLHISYLNKFLSPAVLLYLTLSSLVLVELRVSTIAFYFVWSPAVCFAVSLDNSAVYMGCPLFFQVPSSYKYSFSTETLILL